MLYVIRRKKDGALVTGTDYRYYPRHQILQYPTKPPLIISDYDGELPESIAAEIKHRGINLKYYEIVPVEIKPGGRAGKTMVKTWGLRGILQEV